MPEVFPFESLCAADLIVDATYRGGTRRDTSDDPLSKLIPGAGNQGGFRNVGSRKSPRLVILYSSLADPDWPDYIDIYSGVFTYYGDNKKPGLGLHDTPRGGNRILQACFDRKDDEVLRLEIPPFLVFTRRDSRSRDVVFRGLAAPGVSLTQGGDLVALWRSRKGKRFQNYQAKFTILNVGTTTREWIRAVIGGNPMHPSVPKVWRTWAETGVYDPLVTLPTMQYRSPEEQMPHSDRDAALVTCIYEYFRECPTRFEECAAQLVRMMDNNFNVGEVTRSSVDGGRDAVGHYRLGPIADRISLDFALEAKCYARANGVGVKELSRLISRLRHREFGVMVTTSYLGRQAYEELRNDRHPVVVIAGSDIVRILSDAGLSTTKALQAWLEMSFPKTR